MHLKFAENLVNASHGRELGEAAREWTLHKIDKTELNLRCNLCNQTISHFVVLWNQKNNNRLVIGHDCYDKLVRYLADGQIKSDLPDRKNYTRGLRKYWKGKLPDKTVLGWLLEELNAKRLPEEIAALVRVIELLGFAPTYEDADRVVAYYCSTRKFNVGVLISYARICGFRFMRLVPKVVTIDQATRIEKLIDRDNQQRERLRRKEMEQIRRQEWAVWREQIFQKLTELNIKAIKAVAEGVEEASSALRLLNAHRATIESTCPEVFERSLDEMSSVMNDTFSLLRDFELKHRWSFFPVVEVLAVRQTRRLLWGACADDSYVLMKSDGRWKTMSNLPIRVKTESSLEGGGWKQGMYKAKFDGMNVLLLEKLDSAGKIVEVFFNIKSRRNDGSFVGRYERKIVLPSRPVRRSRKYSVFLLNDEGKYYRAWVLEGRA